MLLQGAICRLRAVEPGDVDAMYAWENDPAVWSVSGTVAPFSRAALERFACRTEDIYAARQSRLIIEAADGRAVGAADLFDFDPQNLRAGVGILVHAESDRRRGYASEALRLLEEYAAGVLRLHQLWCGVGSGNSASLALFRSAGYVRCGRRRDWILSPAGWQDEIEMQKIIR